MFASASLWFTYLFINLFIEVNKETQVFGHRALDLSREKRLARGGRSPKTCLEGTILAPGPPLAKPCVSVPSLRADPDHRSLRTLWRYALLRFTKTFAMLKLRVRRSRFHPCRLNPHDMTVAVQPSHRPTMASSRRYRARWSASSPPTRSAQRPISRASGPLRGTAQPP